MRPHYDTKDWIDFARKTLAQEKIREMQAHLETKCKACSEEARMWDWMRNFAASEAENEPPASAVRIAKAALTGRVVKKSRSVMRELAQLVFDTYAQPQVAGIRSTAAAPRQLLYRAGPIMIDMRLQSGNDADHFALSGQVLKSG